MSKHEPDSGKPSQPVTVAAVDLGSNSFHLVVAHLDDRRFHVVDRLKEMVRLGDGLDSDNNLSAEAQSRAIACLQRFGERLRNIPTGNVRAVGTNTLRSSQNAPGFLRTAQQALGHPIEVIAGIEEARLIYLGVAHSLAASEQRRLVIDIGGGSTELIIGEGYSPLKMESLYMGCVNMTQRFFADGKITEASLRKAELAARIELEPLENAFPEMGWNTVIGASGTIRSVSAVIGALSRAGNAITLAGLQDIAQAMLAAGHVKKLILPGLNADRIDVFPGGVSILLALFKALEIDRMVVSDGAIREGLLYDLIGRFHDDDIRDFSAANLARRFHSDMAHATRVRNTALECLRQTLSSWSLDHAVAQDWLSWSSTLHEIGLDIAHSHYHRHGAYIVANADLAGFTRQEQEIVALMIRYHRRKLAKAGFDTLPEAIQNDVQRLTLLLRLACILHRDRSDSPPPRFRLVVTRKEIDISFPAGWLDAHPLTQADLEQEADYLKAASLRLSFR